VLVIYEGDLHLLTSFGLFHLAFCVPVMNKNVFVVSTFTKKI